MKAIHTVFSHKIIVQMLLIVLTLSLTCGAFAEAASIPAGIPLHDRSALKNWGFFYVGGEYVESEADKGSVMRGQMYVEVFEPAEVTKPYPLVFLHGNYQTGLNWMGTVNGGDGWVDYFLGQGYIAYVCDMPTRGRASYPGEEGLKTRNVTAERALSSFAGVGNEKQHQWPEDISVDSEAFKQFYATQNVSLASNVIMQELAQNACAELLDLIGPAILVTHSQSGPFGWLIADVRPELVKGIVALEPGGPAFSKGNTDFGVAALNMAFEPAVESAEEIETETFVPAENSGLREGPLQKEPARKLVNLAGIPIVIITSEGSYHNTYDYLISAFLTQAGVENEHIYLADRGIHGNGHMMMIENNSLEIAALVNDWITAHVE